MQFKDFDLDPRLNEGIRRSGYDEPTPVQEKVIAPAMEGRDIIGSAQTGTGKTAAFVLPILHRLLKEKRSHVSALIVTPTRELAE
ncbi:MAG: RNA helicase, partial [Elusimicrobia bacterium CG_4_10_14_3_um_filter_49_12_50_7]